MAKSDKSTDSTDPGLAASAAGQAVESVRQEERRTTREFGKNSEGEPVLYSSDVEMLAQAHNLTIPEAEDVWRRSVEGSESEEAAVAAVKGGRVVYRPRYEAVSPTVSHPLVQLDNRAALNDAREGSTVAPTADATQPESGPYGPYADYENHTPSAEEVAQQTGLPVDVVEAVSDDKGKS